MIKTQSTRSANEMKLIPSLKTSIPNPSKPSRVPLQPIPSKSVVPRPVQDKENHRPTALTANTQRLSQSMTGKVEKNPAMLKAVQPAPRTSTSLVNTKQAVDKKEKENALSLLQPAPSSQSMATLRGTVNTLKRPASTAGLTKVTTRQSISKSPKHVEVIDDIDAEDANDPAQVSEYVEDIYEYLRAIEQSRRVSPFYLTKHDTINEKMRATLVDWIVHVCRHFRLMSETLFLAVHVLDRYMEKTQEIARDKYQLVGVAAMLVAAKYEEIFFPEINDFVYISSEAYTRDEIIDAETDVLDALEYSLSYTSPLHFLRRFSKAARSDGQTHSLCKYIIEVTMLDVSLLKYLPSELAAAAVYIARAMRHITPIWNPTIKHHTKYSEGQARTIALEVNQLLKRIPKSKYQAIYEKYSSETQMSVARIALISDL